VLTENEFLRYSNEKVVGIINSRQSTKESNNAEEDTNSNSNSEVEKGLKKLPSKGLHKRQKTHINFNHIQSLKINTELIENQNNITNNSQINNNNSVIHSVK
jgi:hypothetical protein